MTPRAGWIAVCLLGIAQPATAQLSGRETPAGCVDITYPLSRVTATGRLAYHVFAGPPNYENIATGDARETAYILTLPRKTCIEDGGVLADSSIRFDTVHVYSSDPVILKRLPALVGRRVIITGDGEGAVTGHHRARLVLDADRITVQKPHPLNHFATTK
jgi:hypothetical protein